MYLKIPSGLSREKTKGKVWKLRKTLYDFKKSLYAWFDRFNNVVGRFRYTQRNEDHIIFIKNYQDNYNSHSICWWYYDDNKWSQEGLYVEKVSFAKEFEIKNLERMHYFLGIEVARLSKCIFISPMKYILDLLEIRMLSFGLVDSFIEGNHRLDNYEGEVVEKEIY